MTKLEQTNRREQNADATLSYVKSFWKEHGYGPSYRDIEAILNISAGSAVKSVALLVERSVLSVEPGVARSIRPVSRKKGK
jgi:SOS-response transcriptional repressor LexA